jgi:gamma-glutamyltranspeptidase/glutathione hydrolase
MTLHSRSSDPAALLDFPYASQRMPLLAGNVVSTSQPLAASAGLRMLARGGNAVDAALATAIALTVVEPCQNGIGSDTFAIIWAEGKLHGLNASGRAPHKLTPQHFAGRNAIPQRGWDTVTVPGTVSAWRTLSERFGRLPFADLFEPAIRYATDGYLVSPTVHRQWQAQVDALIPQPGYREAFAPNGRAPRPGERWICPGQARTLQLIAETKGEAFYHGELAAAIVAHARATGGVIDESDLAAHRPDWVEPIGMNYRDLTLHEIGPNGQGIGALMALGMLDNFDIASHGLDSVQTLHLQLEAMKLAFADLNEYVGDVDYMKRVRPSDLLNRDYLKQRAKKIDPKRASEPKPGMPNSSGTVYLTAADESGMMISYIQSNFKGFGSGVVVPNTGIALQNRGFGFTLKEGHPNQVGPGKRPFHTIIPGFLTRSGQPMMSFGLMGGSMQAQGHLQITSRIADFGQNPQSASDAPRWRISDDLDAVNVEWNFPREQIEGLQTLGHKINVAKRFDTEFGCAQLALKTDGGYIAASDHRKDGYPVGM